MLLTFAQNEILSCNGSPGDPHAINGDDSQARANQRCLSGHTLQNGCRAGLAKCSSTKSTASLEVPTIGLMMRAPLAHSEAVGHPRSSEFHPRSLCLVGVQTRQSKWERCLPAAAQKMIWTECSTQRRQWRGQCYLFCAKSTISTCPPRERVLHERRASRLLMIKGASIAHSPSWPLSHADFHRYEAFRFCTYYTGSALLRARIVIETRMAKISKDPRDPVPLNN